MANSDPRTCTVANGTVAECRALADSQSNLCPEHLAVAPVACRSCQSTPCQCWDPAGPDCAECGESGERDDGTVCSCPDGKMAARIMAEQAAELRIAVLERGRADLAEKFRRAVKVSQAFTITALGGGWYLLEGERFACKFHGQPAVEGWLEAQSEALVDYTDAGMVIRTETWVG